VATASNLGGIGFGPLAAGLLVQFAPSPLRLSYIVFGAAIVIVAAAVAWSPETARLDRPRPGYRPQRVRVPRAQRGTFFAAALAGASSFAVYGVFTSLAPSFLAGTLHETSHAVAGAVAFAVFAGGAVAQIAQSRVDNQRLLRRGVPTVILGLAVLAAGMWIPNLATFILGGVISGAGAGMVFKGSLVTAAETAPEGSRAEVLAGYFLGSYLGLSVPAIGLGIATNYFLARNVMLVFAIVIASAITMAVRAASRQQRTESRSDRVIASGGHDGLHDSSDKGLIDG
jgi:MFS family permease